MAVKKVIGGAPKRALPPAVAAKIAARAGATAALSELRLPDEAKEPEADIQKYVFLVYGRPGVGKTTLLASWPDAVMLSCERVSRGIRCHDFNAENGGVTSWAVFRRAVELLEQEKRFETVCIDTIDAAYKYCLDAVCKARGIEYPSDDEYGKGWDAVKGEFTETVDRIQRTGRGLVFSSHAKEVEIKTHAGEKFTRIQPTMSGQAYSYVKAKSDFTLYGEFVKDLQGESRRILICTGDELIDAKHAELQEGFPKFLPLEKADGFGLIQRAFSGEDVGIPSSELIAARNTTKSGGAMIQKEKAAEARKRLGR